MRCRSLMPLLLCVVPATLSSCHLVFPHRHSDGGAADRSTQESGVVDGRAEVARSDLLADQRLADQKIADLTVLPPPRVWAWENPIPTWSRLTGVWAAPTEDVVFAVGLEGTILRHEVTANKLTAQKVPGVDPKANLYGVWGRSSTQVYAVGDKIILEYDGTTWKATPVQATLRGISGNATTLFAVGEASGSGVFLSDTDPAKMVAQKVQVPLPLHAVWAQATKAYAAGDKVEDGLYVYSSGSVSLWDKPFFHTTNLSARALWGRASPAELFVAGRYSSNGFATERSGSPAVWHKFPTMIGSSVNGIWGNATETFAVGSGTSLLKRDPSKSWLSVPVQNPWGDFSGIPLHSLSGTGQQLFVVGDYGLFATGTATTSFASVQGAGANRADLVSLWSSVAETIAVGSSTILRRVNATWKKQTLTGLPSGLITAVWGRGQEVFLAVSQLMSYTSTLYRWDLSSAIQELTPPAGADAARFAAIWGGSNSTDKVYFAGDGGTIWVLDPPSQLTVVSQGGSASLQSIWGWPDAAPDTVVAVGTTALIKVVQGVPSTEPAPVPVSRGIWGSSLADLMVVSDQGIHRSTGKTWSANASFGECYSIWGASPKEVYALCAKGLAHWDGSAWKGEPLPDPPARRIDELGGTLFGYPGPPGSRAVLTVVGRGGAILRSE